MLGTPHCAAFAVGSTNPKVDVFVLADLMEGKGNKIVIFHYEKIIPVYVTGYVITGLITQDSVFNFSPRTQA